MFFPKKHKMVRTRSKSASEQEEQARNAEISALITTILRRLEEHEVEIRNLRNQINRQKDKGKAKQHEELPPPVDALIVDIPMDPVWEGWDKLPSQSDVAMFRNALPPTFDATVLSISIED